MSRKKLYRPRYGDLLAELPWVAPPGSQIIRRYQCPRCSIPVAETNPPASKRYPTINVDGTNHRWSCSGLRRTSPDRKTAAPGGAQREGLLPDVDMSRG